MNRDYEISLAKKVLIIGNGFDLDLGLNTRYSDFAKSSGYFKTTTDSSYLKQHLNRVVNNEKWLDLEMELEKYAAISRGIYKTVSSITQREDMDSFESLKSSLTDYLIAEQKKSIKTNSLAALLLQEVAKCSLFQSIYSFNYTDLDSFALQLGIEKSLRFHNVHGSLRQNNIILGVREGTTLKNGYDFLRKTFSPTYASFPILYDLQDAGEVVFFGHSLSPNDYHYFQSFFKAQCREDMRRQDAKRITFFTYDEDSAREIKRQLWIMNENRTDRLFTQNDITFILTKRVNSTDWSDFVSNLHEDEMAILQPIDKLW